jgi:hypothetical protein
MSHDLKKFLGKGYRIMGLYLGHYMWTPPETRLYEPKIVMQNGSASCFRYPRLLAPALAQNRWPFLDKGAHGFQEIALRRSSKPWVAFEPDSAFPNPSAGESIHTPAKFL